MQLKFALRPDSSVVERGPEKAGVGGSIPSLATTFASHTVLRRLAQPENYLGFFDCLRPIAMPAFS
jgi:hypothetical protein